MTTEVKNKPSKSEEVISDSTYIQALTALGLFERIQQTTLTNEGSKQVRELITQTYTQFVNALQPVQEHLLKQINEIIEKDAKILKSALENATASEKLKYAQTVASLTDKQIEIIKLVVESILEEKKEK